MGQNDTVSYRILDPTGNITALVYGDVEACRQPAFAAELMERHPEVEQVGFLRLPESGGADAALRMAGGEFCGNASMCAAVCCILDGDCGKTAESGETETMRLRVSGAADSVILRVRQTGADSFDTAVCMPPALEIQKTAFSFRGLKGEIPTVRLQGIEHLILTPDSVFFALREDRAAAEGAARELCAMRGADALGLLFLEGEAPVCSLTPLVYVPGSGTLFWEGSCASGSAAAGIFLAARYGAPVSVTLMQPGGSLRVECGPDGETWLHGAVRMVGQYRI